MSTLTHLRNVSTLKLDTDKCTGCSVCAIVCPHAVFVMRENKAVIVDSDACMECGACELNCAFDALTVRSGVGCASGIISGLLRTDCGSDDSPSCC